MTSGPPGARPARGEQTRSLILETALRLFRERGYGATTMRAVASEAGVSVGSAYYYFDSKEHLVQAFYDRTQEEHVLASAPVLAAETGFAARLLGVMRARVDTLAPYQEFAGSFFQVAADPASPLSPFSAESTPAREASVALFAEVVRDSGLRVAPELADDLPELLWLYCMGVVLFWVHDSSPGAARTHRLVERTVPMLDRLLGLARLRLLRPVVRDLVELVRELRDVPGAGEAGPATARPRGR